MDCTTFGDDLPLEAHAALQYVSRNLDKHNVFKKSVVEIANWVGCTTPEAMGLYGLLKDAECLVPATIKGAEVYVLDITCVCREPIPDPRAKSSEKLLEEASQVPLDSYQTSHLTTNSRIRKSRKGLPHLDTESVEAWTSPMFSRYLQRKLNTYGTLNFKFVGSYNLVAVSTHISWWKNNQKAEPRVLLKMIDTFVEDPERYAKKGQPLWKAFVYNSRRIHEEAARVADKEFAETAPDEYWTGAPSMAKEKFARKVARRRLQKS